MSEYTIKTTYGFSKFIEYQNIKINAGSLMADADNRMFFTIFDTNEVQQKELQQFLKLTKGKKTLIDVGCSYGAISIAFTSNNLDAVSYAFDGSERAMNALEETLKLNPNLNVKQIRKLVGNTDDGIQCVFDKHQSLAINGSNQQLQSTKIDTFCKTNNIIPDILKIDVEGYEYNVLLGARNIIETYRPLIFIEVHPKFIKEFNNQSIEDIYEFFTSIEYDVVDLDGNKIENYLQILQNEQTDSNRTVWVYNKHE